MNTQVDEPEGWPGGFERLRSGPKARRRMSWIARDRTRPEQVVVVEMPRWPELDRRGRLQVHGDLTEGLGRLGTLRQEGLPRTLHLGSADGDGRFALVREHVEGRTLAEILGAIDLSVSGRLESLIEVTEQLCVLLHGLHRRGVVHGDVVPANVLLGEGSARGRVFLLGLLWAQSERMREGVEGAPEQRFEPPRPATDQWQVARLLREALDAFGPRPPHVPARLVDALARAQEDSIARRFPHIDQLAAALAQVRRELAPKAPAPVPETPTEAAPVAGAGAPQPGSPLSSSATLEPLDADSLAPTLETGAVRGPDSISPAADFKLPPMQRRAAPREDSRDDTADLFVRSIRPHRWWAWGLGIVVCAIGAAVLGWTLAAPYAPSATTASPIVAPPSLQAAGVEGQVRDAGEAPASVLDQTAGELLAKAREDRAASALGSPGGRAASAASIDGSTPPPPSPAPALPNIAKPSSAPGPCTARQASGCRARARRALRAGRPRTARRLYERGCDGRDPLACAALAQMWKNGSGGPRRRRTAVAFARRACALGHTRSCRGP